MNPQGDELGNRILTAIDEGNAAELQEIVGDVATFCFKEPAGQEFDQQSFELILTLMLQPQFLNLDGAYHLLLWFEYDWGALTQRQKQRLRERIEESYSRYRDWMSCFVLSSILGECYCDPASFAILARVALSAEELPRALVPTGFELLARNTSDRALEEKSIGQLTKLLTDPSPKVRSEAAESLDRLARHNSEKGANHRGVS